MSVNTKKYSFVNNVFTMILLSSFLFFYALKFEYFQVRFLILILLIPSIFKILEDFKNKKFTFFKYFILFSIFLILQISINLFLEKNFITQKTLFSISFMLLIFIISYYYSERVNNNLDFLVKFFLIIFIISTALSLYFYKYDSPYFCGGVIDYINIYLYQNVVDPQKFGMDKISFKGFLFQENSHFGMIAPSVLAYCIFKTLNNSFNSFFKFCTFIFLILCFIKSSTTLLVGLSISLFIIILFNFNKFSKLILFSYSIIIIGSLSILITDSECSSRMIFSKLKDLPASFNLNSSRSKIKSLEHNPETHLDGQFHPKSSKNIKNSYNLSTSIYVRSLKVLNESIILKPLGWGLNRYSDAYTFFTDNVLSKEAIINDKIYGYNNNDGTNNFIKIFVEFGIFGIFFYLLILVFVINRSVPIELKLFYLPFIITQSIRGAGYFNGGFTLIAFLIFFSYINIVKK